MNRRTQLCLALYGLVVISLMLITPAGRPLRAQSATPGLVDYLRAQATANAMATQSAYQQQQAAAGAAQAAAGLQAQAAAAQAQAAAAQSLAAAAYAQATADASRSRPVWRPSKPRWMRLCCRPRSSRSRRAPRWKSAVNKRARHCRLKRLAPARRWSPVRRRAHLMRHAQQSHCKLRPRSAMPRRWGHLCMPVWKRPASPMPHLRLARTTVSTALSVVVSVLGLAVILVALLLLGRWFKRQWWQLGRPQPMSPTMGGGASTAALLVIDAATGQTAPRVGHIDIILDSAAAPDLEQAFHAVAY